MDHNEQTAQLVNELETALATWNEAAKAWQSAQDDNTGAKCLHSDLRMNHER